MALTHIRRALTQVGRAGLSQVQAIAGLGGVGKTQTALEYAYRYIYEAKLGPDHPDTQKLQGWVDKGEEGKRKREMNC